MELKDRLNSGYEIDNVSGCWNWIKSKRNNGYGQIGNGKNIFYAHRVSYELAKGKIPEGLEIDHLCRNRGCVNPYHLEAVNRRENLLRGNTITAQKAAQTHYIRGHPLVENNVIISKRGTRECKECRRQRTHRYRYGA